MSIAMGGNKPTKDLMMGLIAEKVDQICAKEKLTMSEFTLKYPHMIDLLLKELEQQKGAKNERFNEIRKKQLLKG
tara:strand:- start:30982 stop:31206 length:225 start_codon:yes stop_codon:yes gene_type:complete